MEGSLRAPWGFYNRGGGTVDQKDWPKNKFSGFPAPFGARGSVVIFAQGPQGGWFLQEKNLRNRKNSRIMSQKLQAASFPWCLGGGTRVVAVAVVVDDGLRVAVAVWDWVSVPAEDQGRV